MYRANYPRHGSEVLQDGKKYKPAVLQAVRELRRSKAWRGTPAEQLAKFKACLEKLAKAYGIPCPSLNVAPALVDCYQPGRNAISLSKFSVVTLLHEFGHARGFDEEQACRWSLNLFRRLFRHSYANCHFEGHVLVRNS